MLRLPDRILKFISIIYLLANRHKSTQTSVQEDSQNVERNQYIFHYLWLQVATIVLCLMISSYLTGLNIGLLSLNKFEMLYLIYKGSKKERYLATTLIFYLDRKHQSLLTILVVKTFCESVLTLLLDDLVKKLLHSNFSLLITACLSSIVLLVIGEIIPQTLFMKFSMEICALTHHFLDFLWFITLPITLPFSKLLDFIMGKDKLKTSNQRSNLSTIFTQVLYSGNKRHVRIILKAFGIKDQIKNHVNFNFCESQVESGEEDGGKEGTEGHSGSSQCLNILLKKDKGTDSLIIKPKNIVRIEQLKPVFERIEKFFTCESFDRASNILYRMRKDFTPYCIVFGAESANLPYTIQGYVNQEELVEGLVSRMQEIQSKKALDENYKSFITNSSIISKCDEQTYDIYVAMRTFLQRTNLPASKIRLLNKIRERNLRICTVNENGVSDPRFMIAKGKPLDFVAILLTTETQISISNKLLSEDCTTSSDIISHKPTSVHAIMPQYSIIGLEYFEELQANGQASSRLQFEAPIDFVFCGTSIKYWVLNKEELCSLICGA